MLFLFLVYCFSKESYVKSVFGSPGTDEVHNEYVPGIEVLQRGLKKPTLKPVSEAHYTSSKIEDDDYPWPGHDYEGTCTPELLQAEADAISKAYKRIDLTQEDVYYHPAAAKQCYTTQEDLNKADRVKIKYVITGGYDQHLLPAFIPPGEVVTFEISETVANKDILGITINTQYRESDTGKKQRLPNMIIRNLRLTKTVCTIASPYGATVNFHYGDTNPCDVIVSGVILQPYFYYGMNSDEEWENELSKLPGPYAFLDTGNLVHIVPSSFVRDTVRMNDCMHYWRSAVQISQTTARDVSQNKNPRHGRILHPCTMKYDSFVPAGAACCYPAGNFVHFPCGWISSTVNYDSSVDNPWGTVHELNHNHQENWAKTQESGEMSNNAVSLVIYAKTNLCSGARLTSGWPRYAYASHMLNNQDSYGLQRYSTMLHFFGVKKFKKFVEADQEGFWYSRDEYGIPGAEMLKASRVMNRDMRYHWNFHGTDDGALGSKTLKELEKMKLKPFHPVTNIYAVGNILDGEAFITARPYRIDMYEQTIDFVGTMVQREDTEKFGNFEFQKATFESGRESAWKEQSKGVYKMTPKENQTLIEEVNVSYLDKTTNEVHVVICQFTTFFSSNSLAQKTIYGNIPDGKGLLNSYRYITQNLTEDTESSIIESGFQKANGIAQDWYTNKNVNTWLSILEGKLTPPSDGTYVFSCTGDAQVAFYLSEEPLQGDPDLDEEHLINFQPTRAMNYDSGNKSKPLQLVHGKLYYFRHIVYPNNDRSGCGWVGFKKNNEGSFANVPQSWFKFSDKELSDEDRFKFQYRPDFERIYLMDEWNGQNRKRVDPSKWNVYKLPNGEVRVNSNDYQGQTSDSVTPTQALIDGDPTTEYRVDWWPQNKYTKFPHIFEIDMGDKTSFQFIRIGAAGNPGFFGMNSYLKIYLAPYNYSQPVPKDENDTSTTPVPYTESNYSISHEESLIWEGNFSAETKDSIELDKYYSGRYLKLAFINNSKPWKDGHPGRTCISSVEVGSILHNKKVYPITNTRYFTMQNRWDEKRNGFYYNGKGYTGYAKDAAPTKENNNKNSVLEIKIPKLKPEFGIIGDYYPSMGTATVKLDGKQIGEIGKEPFDPIGDNKKLLYASRAYRSILFYIHDLDPSKQHKLTVEVTKGEVTFAGILTHQMVVKWNTDDWRYPRILETEFSDNPEQFDWDTPTDELEPNSGKSGKKKGMSPGAIAACVIVPVVVVAAVVVTVFIMYKKEMLCFNHDVDVDDDVTTTQMENTSGEV